MAQDVRLLKSQRNAVLQIVETTGLKPVDFEWRNEEWWDCGDGMGGVQFLTSVLYHVPPGFYYKFGQCTDIYAPADSAREGRFSHPYRYEENQFARFRNLGGWLL